MGLNEIVRLRAPKLQRLKVVRLVKLFFCCEIKLLLRGTLAKPLLCVAVHKTTTASTGVRTATRHTLVVLLDLQLKLLPLLLLFNSNNMFGLILDPFFLT